MLRISLRFAQHDRLAYLFASLSAEFPHQLHRFINSFRRDIERGTEADRVLAGAKRQNAKIEEAVPEFFARFRVR